MITKTVKSVAENEVITFEGDTYVTGNILPGASVTVIDGSLTVGGDIQIGSKVELRLGKQSVSGDNIGAVVMRDFSGSISSSTSSTLSPMLYITVKGNVGNKVTIKSQNADIKINGNVGNNCSLKTKDGSITAGDVGSSTQLITHHGNISAKKIGSLSVAETYCGNVQAENVDPSATVKTHYGCISNVGGDGDSDSYSSYATTSTGNATNVTFFGKGTYIDKVESGAKLVINFGPPS